MKVGPLIDAQQRDKVAELVDDAVANGAKMLVGGHAVDGPGYFYEPTVLVDVPPDARLLREESSGPVAPVIGFDSEDAAVKAANDTEYGLVAYVYTNDSKRAFRVCERLETGMVGVNQGMVSNAAAPFGGIKASGFGREGGLEGIHEYLEVKYIAMVLLVNRHTASPWPARGNIRGNIQIVHFVHSVQIPGRSGRSGRYGRI